MSREISAAPTRGRFFPCTFAELGRRVEGLGFATYEHHPRLAISLQNCSAECSFGHQLASFFRLNYIAAFSLPESVAPALAAAALEESLAQFAAIDRGPHLSVREQQFVVYRAFLGPLGRLTVAQHVVSAGSRSYLQFKRAAMLSKRECASADQRVLLERSVA